MIEPLTIKRNDLQPAYPFKIVDSSGAAVDLTGAAIYCTMKNITTGVVKINRQTTGIAIKDQVVYKGEAYYQWQSGDTDTAGKYLIEFEINPAQGGKFTVPPDNSAMVLIIESLDSQ